MIKDIVEVLVYAAALDVYRRENRITAGLQRRDQRSLTARESNSMLMIVEWTARPSCLEP